MREIRDRRILCGWCGMDKKDGHTDDCHMKPVPQRRLGVQHDPQVRAQAIQDLEDRYRETCRSLYIRAKREGAREERERCLTRRYPIPFRAIEAVLTYYPPKEHKIVREWLEDISAAIHN